MTRENEGCGAALTLSDAVRVLDARLLCTDADAETVSAWLVVRGFLNTCRWRDAVLELPEDGNNKIVICEADDGSRRYDFARYVSGMWHLREPHALDTEEWRVVRWAEFPSSDFMFGRGSEA